MLTRDMLLAALTSVIWGLGCVVAKFGLESFSATQMTALRFLMVGVFIVIVPRPKVPWPSLIAIGATLFTGQFLLLFFAFTHGLPPGLASVSQQVQAFFTVLLCAVFLRKIPGCAAVDRHGDRIRRPRPHCRDRRIGSETSSASASPLLPPSAGRSMRALTPARRWR
ncbi:MAG TPA: EamA family transporter [Bradyrhizobium sp.]|nr:EamA family transporter [Bradyrhizobium sp.]